MTIRPEGLTRWQFAPKDTPTLATSDVQDAALGFLAAHERDVVKLILDLQRCCGSRDANLRRLVQRLLNRHHEIHRRIEVGRATEAGHSSISAALNTGGVLRRPIPN